MNYAYLLSVIGSRGVTLVTVVILSHLLSPGDFGIYALAATNALLTQIAFGSWIATGANKYVALGGREVDPATVSTIAAALCGYWLLMLLLGTVYALFPFAGASPAQVAIVLGWSATLVFHDTTLANKNALGQGGAYAVLALARNLAGCFLSIFLVVEGYGAIGAMLGQIAGTFLPTLLLGSSIRIWKHARLSKASGALLLQLLKFGAAGTLAVGFYVLFNAATRNMVGLFLGEAEAGYMSLAVDLFFGPISLLGTAYSLSILPGLYVVEAGGSEEEKRRGVSGFFDMLLFLALPYGVAGAMLAPEIVALVLPAESRAAVGGIAGAAAVQSALLVMLTGLDQTFLIFNRRLLLIPAVLGTALLNAAALAVALNAGASLQAAAWLSVAVLGCGAVILSVWAAARWLLRPDFATLVKIGVGAAAMAGAIWLYERVLVPGEVFGAILIGGGVYLGITALCGVHYVRELAPKRRAVAERLPAGPAAD